MLQALLNTLNRQQTERLFTYSIVVADNDDARSAEEVVEKFRALSVVPIHYYAESNRNIALARNKAVENATGDYVAFIDDDEVAVDDWLLHLYKTSLKCQADAVLGPVVAAYECPPPHW